MNDCEHYKEHHLKYEDAKDCDLSDDEVAFCGCCSHILRGHRERIYDDMDSSDDEKESLFFAYYQSMDRHKRNILDILSKLHSMLSHTKKSDLSDEKDESAYFQRARARVE